MTPSLFLNRDDKFALLRMLKLTPPAGSRSVHGVFNLLIQIEFCSTGSGGSKIRQLLLAERLNISVRTLRRWIRTAEQLQVLHVRERKNPAGQMSNHYSIDWTKIRQLVRQQSAAPSVAVKPIRKAATVEPSEFISGQQAAPSVATESVVLIESQADRPPPDRRPVGSLVATGEHLTAGHDDRPPGHHGRPPRPSCPAGNRPLVDVQINPLPLSESVSNDRRPADWRLVEEVLLNSEIVNVAKCVDALKRRKETPDDVIDAVAVWRTMADDGAYSSAGGALFCRCMYGKLPSPTAAYQARQKKIVSAAADDRESKFEQLKRLPVADVRQLVDACRTSGRVKLADAIADDFFKLTGATARPLFEFLESQK